MNRKIWLILIAVEVLILFAMIMADFGFISSKTVPFSPKSIIMHITTVIVIFICIDAYKKSN